MSFVFVLVFFAKKEKKLGTDEDEEVVAVLDGALVELVAEAERDDDEEEVEDEHHDAHTFCHLPLERDDSLENIHISLFYLVSISHIFMRGFFCIKVSGKAFLIIKCW